MIELPADNYRVVPEDPRTYHGVSEYVPPSTSSISGEDSKRVPAFDIILKL